MPSTAAGLRVLVTGGGGQVGRELQLLGAELGVDVLAFERAELDVTDAHTVGEAIRSSAPDRVIHCAAWTAVDAAEAERAAAFLVNEQGTRNVAEACAATRTHLVHVSTEMIFDGREPGGYVEDAPANPISAYGASKLAAEAAVHEVSPDACVARTSWVFGAYGDNFVKTIARLAAGREVLDVVADQIGRPTWARHLADALLSLAARRTAGVAHVAGSPVVTKADWAREIIAAAGLPTTVRDVGSERFPLPAARPHCAVLEVSREDTPHCGDWREGLAPTLAGIDPGS